MARRTPTKILELRGAFKKNPGRKRGSEPVPAGGIGDCPEDLSKWHPEARTIWNEFVASSAPGVLTCSDRRSLALLCKLEWELRYDYEKLTGAKIGHYRLLSSSFGFTPADRSRVSVPREDDPQSEGYWNQFTRGKQ